jgi:hypothetical protein
VSDFSEDNENTPNLYKSSGEKITFTLDHKEAIATLDVRPPARLKGESHEIEVLMPVGAPRLIRWISATKDATTIVPTREPKTAA